MNEKEEILKLVKEQMPQWTDEQCLAFIEQEEKMQSEIETCQVWYAYYIQSERTNKRRYGIAPEKEYLEKYLEKAYDHKRCHSKLEAERKLEEWKDNFRY